MTPNRTTPASLSKFNLTIAIHVPVRRNLNWSVRNDFRSLASQFRDSKTDFAFGGLKLPAPSFGGVPVSNLENSLRLHLAYFRPVFASKNCLIASKNPASVADSRNMRICSRVTPSSRPMSELLLFITNIAAARKVSL